MVDGELRSTIHVQEQKKCWETISKGGQDSLKYPQQGLSSHVIRTINATRSERKFEAKAESHLNRTEQNDGASGGKCGFESRGFAFMHSPSTAVIVKPTT
jgi:hypothetical protein